MTSCDEEETLEHHLIGGYRTKVMRTKMNSVSFNVHVNPCSMMFTEKLPDTKRWLFWLIMCVIDTHIWKTRSEVILNQEMIHNDSVLENIIADLKGWRTVSLKKGSSVLLAYSKYLKTYLFVHIYFKIIYLWNCIPFLLI